MNLYKAFFNSATTEVKAETSYKAFEAAVAHFKPSKSKKHLVSVHLLQTDIDTATPTTIVHTPYF